MTKLATPPASTRDLTHPEPSRPSAGGARGAAFRYGVPAVIVLVLLAAVWAVAGRNTIASGGSTGLTGASFEVTRRTFDLTVIASGELEAKRKVELKSDVEGAPAIVELVPEGTFAKAGDVLVRLADDEIRQKIEQATLDLERAQADQVAAEQALAIQQNQGRSDISAAELKLSLAQLELAKWEKGTDPQTQRDNQLALEKAIRELDRAKENVELSKQLAAEKFISTNELKDDETKLLEAENALATATLNIEVYNNFTRPKEQKKMRSDVDQAQAELDRTRSKLTSDIERLKADLSSKTRTTKIRQDRYDFLQNQLDLTVIKAPEDGLVVYATSVGRRRGDPLTQGRQVRMGESLILLPDTSQMVAAVKVNETLVNQVNADQPVTVTIDARRAKPVQGTVSQIGVTAEDGGWINPDLREYIVRVDLPAGLDPSLKPGMRCTGEILIGRVEDAIAVPVQAVFSEGEKRFCYVKQGVGVAKKPVKVGRASETYAEILDGLSGGETVLLRKAKPGEALTPAKS